MTCLKVRCYGFKWRPCCCCHKLAFKVKYYVLYRNEGRCGCVAHIFITLKQSWVYSGVAHILFRVYSGVEYRHVYSTQLSRIYECILNTLYWVDTHTLYSAELNASHCATKSTVRIFEDLRYFCRVHSDQLYSTQLNWVERNAWVWVYPNIHYQTALKSTFKSFLKLYMLLVHKCPTLGNSNKCFM